MGRESSVNGSRRIFDPPADSESVFDLEDGDDPLSDLEDGKQSVFDVFCGDAALAGCEATFVSAGSGFGFNHFCEDAFCLSPLAIGGPLSDTLCKSVAGFDFICGAPPRFDLFRGGAAGFKTHSTTRSSADVADFVSACDEGSDSGTLGDGIADWYTSDEEESSSTPGPTGFVSDELDTDVLDTDTLFDR